jgi:hypothetical protein
MDMPLGLFLGRNHHQPSITHAALGDHMIGGSFDPDKN